MCVDASTPRLEGVIMPCARASPSARTALARSTRRGPVTSHVKGYPFEVPLPSKGKITGVVLADHVKNLDWRARRAVFGEKALPETLADVRERLRTVIGL